jgi:hypothetical protein
MGGSESGDVLNLVTQAFCTRARHSLSRNVSTPRLCRQGCARPRRRPPCVRRAIAGATNEAAARTCQRAGRHLGKDSPGRPSSFGRRREWRNPGGGHAGGMGRGHGDIVNCIFKTLQDRPPSVIRQFPDGLGWPARCAGGHAKAHGKDSLCQPCEVYRYHSAETEHFARPGSVLVQRQAPQLAGGMGAELGRTRHIVDFLGAGEGTITPATPKRESKGDADHL